ncbi:Hypothetical predicted protein [Cloeon dipterum]|uniref:Lipid-binding serum glycoprotein N-terminal domain-containing protein n=1 Tax=Cloeon dipterum TaxID=197152 RepID=A0A8S1BW97_9INSE|nr:Hypothetical predicted protein [Cloeon dipterum]
MKLQFALVALACLLAASAARTIPSYVKICSRNDPQLNRCLVDSVDKLRPYLAKGIPEFRIPPYDPLLIPKVSLTQGEGPVSFKSEFNNLKTSGARDVVVRDVEVDLKNLVVTLDLFFPKLRIQSDYEVDGRILVVPVQGSGYSDGNFTSVEAHIVLSGNEEKRKELTYVSLKDRTVKLEIGGATMHFDNLFNGNKQLGDTTNRFFNENWRDIVREIKPVLEDTIAEVVHGIVRQVFDLYPLEQLLPETAP